MSTSAYAIEKKVPMPGRRAGRPALYPFATLKVGDSFAVPTADAGANGSRIRSAATAFTRRHPDMVFSIRKEAEAFRVWRVKG